MKKESDINQRIPMFVESQRGDDRIGTGPDGALTSDHAAKEAGVAFVPGVPQAMIQEAVEQQLKDEKWVVLEKKDGSSELLTRKDIPEPEKVKEDEEKTGDVGGAGAGDAETPGKAGEEDWRSVFSAVPVKPKPEEPAANPIVKPACTAGPKKETEKWESKFKNIKSATATNKGKGG